MRTQTCPLFSTPPRATSRFPAIFWTFASPETWEGANPNLSAFSVRVISSGMATDPSDDLFPQVRNPPNTRVINDRCLIRTQDEHRLVIVSGIVLAPYALTDDRAQAYAMVSLVEQGWANQREVARAWDCSARTVRRHQRRFEAGGLAAWGRGRGYPQGRRRLQRARIQLIQRLKAEGCANREIARQLGVSEVAIRKLLRRLGWQEPTAEPMALALDLNPSAPSNLSAPSKPARVQPSPEPAPTAPLPSSAIGSTAAAATTLDTDPRAIAGATD